MQTPRSDQDPNTKSDSRQQALVETLRASEELFRTAFLYSPVGMCITTPDGRLQNVNQALVDMLGFTKAELEGKHFNDITHPEDLEIGKDVVGRMISGAAPSVAFEKRYLRKNGEVVWTHVNSVLLREASGKPLYLITQILDITERRQVEEQLREGEEKYRAFFLNSMDAILLTSPDGSIQSANPAACKMLGRTEAEICALGRSGLIDMNDPRLGPLLEERARTGKAFGELTMFRHDGSPFAVEMSSALFQDGQGNTRTSMIIRDITERKQAEDALRESEARYHHILDTMMEGCQIIDFDWRYVYINEVVAAQQARLGPEEMLNHTVMELYPGVEKTELFAALRRCMEERVPARMETQFIFPDGRLGWFELSIHPAREGIFILSTDITERKRAEDEVRGKQELFQKTFDISPLASVLSKLPERIVVDANPAFEELFGYTRADMIGRSVMEFDLWADASERQKVAKILSNGGSVHGYEFVFKTRSGGTGYGIFYSETIEQLTDKYVLVKVLDITERKQAEEKIERHNQRFSILREIDTAILAADTVEDIVGAALSRIRELIECQRASLTLIDWRTNEALTFDVRTVNETSAPKGTRVPLALFQDVIQTLSKNQPVLINDLTALPDPPPQIQAIIKEGLRSLCVLPLLSQSSLIGGISMHSDSPAFFDEEKIGLGREIANQVAIAITQNNLLNELRDLNADLEQRVAGRTEELHLMNIELQNAIRTRDEFLAGMSHELRTPLNAIIGFTGTLLMKLPGPLTADQEKQLTTIQTSARHLLSLINDLLDLARIASGKVELKLEPVACQHVIEEVVTTLRPLVEAKGLQVKITTPAENITLQTDRRALHQIILNLSNNAIKFTEQGEIRLELRQRSENGRSAVEISVADTGMGIRAEDQVKLFEAFEQVRSSASRRQEGTGLGLHLSQKLAGLLGGQITFISEHGKGSTFTLVLPES